MISIYFFYRTSVGLNLKQISGQAPYYDALSNLLDVSLTLTLSNSFFSFNSAFIVCLSPLL